MRKQLCLWLSGGLVAFASATAHAEDEPKPYPECTKEPTDAEVGAAKGAYQAGTASFDEADYPRALTYWEDAYRRDCTANLLLKNLARAYELSGQKRQAVVAPETFLVREPASNEKEQIQRRIEALKKQIAAEKSVTPVGAAEPAQPPPVKAAPVTEPIPQPTGGKKSIVPLVVAGSGGLVFLVGLGVFASGAKDTSNFEKQCPNRQCPLNVGPNPTETEKAVALATQQKLIDDGNKARSREVAGGVLTGVGAAVAAGGIIWYVLEPRSSATATTTGTWLRPRFDAAVTPTYSGFSLSGAF